MISTTTPGIPMAVILAALVGVGCASMGNTLAQDLAQERWEKCKDVSRQVQLKEIRPDGQIWITYFSGEDLRTVRACLAQAQAAQAQRRTAVAAPVAVVGSPAGASGLSPQGLQAPIWKTGDEWAYRNEQPSGASTFVWAVARTDTIEGIPHYVIRSGSGREIFHRASDLAITHQRVAGDLTNNYRPPWVFVTFPLTVGKTWETRFTEERPVDRQTEEFDLSCAASAAEAPTVPAGTFDTIRVLCKNSRTGTMYRRFWFSPAVKHMVKEEAAIASGIRTRELIAFKLR